MLSAEWTAEGGWSAAELHRLENWPLSPFCAALHYGQSVFEGLKAHRTGDGRVAIFRCDDHGHRFARSARRMAMPELDPAEFKRLVKAFVAHQQPLLNDHDALYLRPLLFASEAALGVRPARQFRLAILGAVVGEYFKTGGHKVRLLVSDRYCRAAPGGTGGAKTSGNYAASLLAQQEAATLGFHQVLWLDARERLWVEETGAMNIVFATRGGILTPPIGDTVLDGVTRKTVLTLAPELGLEVEERKLRWSEVRERIAAGDITEAFGVGTAALVAPIGELGSSEGVVTLRGGEIADRLKTALRAEQRGHGKHAADWLTFAV
jgi:branched-chain amino acid aminotransferase